MNKILIVGHPQSGYQDVEALLHACGMARAQPSRREGFLPEQISDTLCKAHGAAPVQELGEGHDVRQIQAGPVWHGMALDLMLGNLDQPLWGWADPQSLYLLDYWRDLDPTIHFILVYDQPHSALTRASEEETASLTPEALARRTNAWATYNAALLHFFHRNASRCLLVHSRQVHASASRYLQQVRARIDAPWAETLERVAGPEATSDVTHPVLVPDQATAASLRTLLTEDPPLALFIANALTQHQPQSLALYEELQASANLPLADESERMGTSTTALQAWHAMVAQQQQLDEAHRRFETQSTQIDVERANYGQALARMEDETARATQAAKQESELLLTQLHQMQEELERQYLGAVEQAKRLTVVRGEQQLIQQQREQAELLAQQRQQQLEEIRRRLAVAERATDPALAEENKLLLTQLHKVQEELERYFLENRSLKANSNLAPQPAPAQAKPIPTQSYYGAGDRIRQQLTYRVGATLLERSRTITGCIGMPFAVLALVRQHKSELPLRQEQKLPPIHTYRDAHDAERVRNHLSYRLGETFLKNARSPLGWIRMPLALSREVNAFRQRQTR